MALIGYARISTDSQSTDLQIDALKAAGCERIFTDIVSGAKADREGLKAALDFLREGDALVAWKLDRIGRSLTHLVATINELDARGIGFPYWSTLVNVVVLPSESTSLETYSVFGSQLIVNVANPAPIADGTLTVCKN